MQATGGLNDNAPMKQTAVATGAIIVQIQGNGNSVVAELPHLELTRPRGISSRIRTDSASRPYEIDVIRPFTRSIDLVGREDELADLRAWLRDDSPIKVRVLTGPAGYGKTRLGLEVIEQMASEGWRSGFLTRAELIRFRSQQNCAAWGWNAPVLAVVDYASASANVLHSWLKELADHPFLERPSGKCEAPLRILLLDRQAERGRGWWRQVFGLGDRAAVLEQLVDPASPVPLRPLSDVDQRRAILSRTLERLVSDVTLPTPGADTHFDHQLATLTWGGVPLLLMSAAVTAAREGFGGVLALNADGLASNIAETELVRIRTVVEGQGVCSALMDLVDHLTAVATLREGLSAKDAVDAIARESAALGYRLPVGPAALGNALAVALPDGAGGIAAIEPDIVGEALLLRVWDENNARAITAIARTHAIAPIPVTQVVIRTCQDYVIRGHRRPLDWLEQILNDSTDLDALLALSNAMPPETLALRHIACVVDEKIVAEFRRLTGADDRYAPKLAWALFGLSERLFALGRQEPALSAAQEAARRYRALAEIHPATFQPYLASSLSNLSARLSALERREPALAAAEEATATHRDLAKTNPGEFQHGLAGSLDTLSNCLAGLGQQRRAVAASEEATVHYRALVASRPDKFRPHLAQSLHHLSHHLTALRRWEHALATREEATALYRALNAADPDEYRPSLANSLNSLSTCLSELGKWEAALAASDEATQLGRDLVGNCADAFRSNLAGYLSNMARCWMSLERADKALAALEEATELLRTTARNNPEASRTSLSAVLNNLAGCLLGLRREHPALAAIEEAVELRRALADATPNAFQPALAESLVVLSKCWASLARQERSPAAGKKALEASEEAVAIHGALATADPEAFRPALATSLDNRSAILFDGGQSEAALSASVEAVKAMSQSFLERPEALAGPMWSIIDRYLKLCKELPARPDDALLARIRREFLRMRAESPRDIARGREA